MRSKYSKQWSSIGKLTGRTATLSGVEINQRDILTPKEGGTTEEGKVGLDGGTDILLVAKERRKEESGVKLIYYIQKDSPGSQSDWLHTSQQFAARLQLCSTPCPKYCTISIDSTPLVTSDHLDEIWISSNPLGHCDRRKFSSVLPRRGRKIGHFWPVTTIWIRQKSR